MTDSPPPALDVQKVAAARLHAIDRFPYLASALFAAPVLEVPELGRVMVDEWWRIHADPTAVDEFTVPELAGELLHLTGHLLRDHAARARAVGFDEAAELHHWVDAADAELVDDLPADLLSSDAVRPDALGCDEGRLAEEYYRRGILTRAEVRDSHLSNVLSSAIGGPRTTPITSRTAMHWGDVILLCSDGLTRHVPDQRIRERLLAMESAKETCELLLQDALDGGGEDNITIVVGRAQQDD